MSQVLLQLRAELESRFEVPWKLRRRTHIEAFSTGIPAIDQLTNGGIPRGTLTEIWGGASSGKTALMFSLLAQATLRGECCAWIDAGGVFDPASALEAQVKLERVLWVNCGGNVEHALKSTDLFIQAGGFGLVVLDLAEAQASVTRRISLASWFRLRHAAERTGAALVAVERQIHARSCSALQIEMRRKQPLWRGKLLRGVAAQAESRKHHRSQTAMFEAMR